jgi:hypothetical protein
MAVSGPSLAILSPQNDFQVPPITTAPPVASQLSPAAQPPVAEQPEVAAAIVTTQNQVFLQPVQVTGRASDQGMPEPVEVDSVTVQVDGGPPMKARLQHVAAGNSQTVVDFALTVVIPHIEGAHTITATATDDNDLTATQSVRVFVGPPFQIAPAAALAELIPPVSNPHLTPSLVSRWTLEIQQHLAPLAALLAEYGLVLAGPSMVLDQDTHVLRVGLWLGDPAFPAVPAGTSGAPLPNLSDTQAAACFAVTPPVLVPGTAAYAVSIPATTLQSLLNAAAPTISAAAARHNLTLDTFIVTTTPPDIATTAMSGSIPGGVPVVLTFTETLGTEALPSGQSVPTILRSQGQSSVGNIFDQIAAVLCPVLFAYLAYATIDIGSDVGGDANKVTGIVGPLVAQIPHAIPFRNTDISSSDPLKFDFPVLDMSWSSFVATDAGITGTGVLSIGSRQQSDVSLGIQGATGINGTAADFAEGYAERYVFTLQNLDPDSFTWTLSGDAQAPGTIVAGPFTQTGDFTVPIRLPEVVELQTYQFTLSVDATETCGTDPTKTLTAAWSSPITVRVEPSPLPWPGEPGSQPSAESR